MEEPLKVIDSCVFGEVTQPLFAVGKLWKTGWGMEPYSHEKAFLVKGNSRIPISFHRNSTMTEVRIYRAEARSIQEEKAKRTVKRVEIREGLKECLDREKWTDGWFFLPDGRPARFDWSTRTTYDPTEDSMEFPYRTVFYGPCSGDEILWSEMEMFSCAEEWQGFEVMEFEKVEDVVITIMERKPQEVSRYIYERQREPEKKSQEEASSSSDAKKDNERQFPEGAQEKLEKRLPAIGEDEFEEKMIVGGVELTPESSLKELKQACKHLGIGVTGSKPLLWQRLKKEVAENKLKTMVDVSKSIQKEFERDPSGPKPVYEPTPEERALHELTHLPKADWCESCTATRSREDNFETSRKRQDGSLVSMDFKFTGTRDEENAKDAVDFRTSASGCGAWSLPAGRASPIRLRSAKLRKQAFFWKASQVVIGRRQGHQIEVLGTISGVLMPPATVPQAITEALRHTNGALDLTTDCKGALKTLNSRVPRKSSMPEWGEVWHHRTELTCSSESPRGRQDCHGGK